MTVNWNEEAAKAGYDHAQCQLGMDLISGANYYQNTAPIQRNESAGLFWLRKAAAQGHDHAQYILAFYIKAVGTGAAKALNPLNRRLAATLDDGLAPVDDIAQKVLGNCQHGFSRAFQHPKAATFSFFGTMWRLRFSKTLPPLFGS